MLPLPRPFSDTAQGASDYRLSGESGIDTGYESRLRPREWKPGVDGWKIENRDCPAFFRHEVEGGTVIRVGPRCADEEIPYAL